MNNLKTNKMKLKSLLLGSCIVLASSYANATEEPGLGDDTHKTDINGGVIHAETKKPLNNVSVTAYLVSKKEKVVITDANGSYNFDDLKPGVYKFIFEKEGFRRVTKEKILIRGDEAFNLSVEMAEVDDFNFIPNTFNFSGLE